VCAGESPPERGEGNRAGEDAGAMTAGREIPCGAVGPTVPRILRLSRDVHASRDGERFALLHVVSGERHYLGWFVLDDDPWRVGLVPAEVVVDAGVPAVDVRRETNEVLNALRAAEAAGASDEPEPIGPVVNLLRHRVDRRRAIERLQHEVTQL
jgi:hypothetical protein